MHRRRNQGGFMSDHRIDRRAFNVAWAYALLAGAVITITGCGGDDSPAAPSTGGNTTTPPPAATDKEGAVSNNHGHRAVITAAQLTAGGALEINIENTGT